MSERSGGVHLVFYSGHHSIFRLKTVSFMWVMCPAHFSRRCQQGTMVRLGSCWQTISGVCAISSCFLYTKALLKWIVLIYSSFIRLTWMTWKTELFVYLLWLGFTMRTLKRTPSDPFQGLMCIWFWEWSQMLGSAGCSRYIHSADILAWYKHDFNHSGASSHFSSQHIWGKTPGGIHAVFLNPESDNAFCFCCSSYLCTHSENLAISHVQPCGEWQSLTSAVD